MKAKRLIGGITAFCILGVGAWYAGYKMRTPSAAYEHYNALGRYDCCYATIVKEENKISDATCTKGALYYRSCNLCGKKSEEYVFEVGEPLGHIGGTATETEKATCARCGEKYGETLK